MPVEKSISDKLFDVCSLEALKVRLPNYSLNHKWEVVAGPHWKSADRLGIARPIAGESIQMKCAKHAAIMVNGKKSVCKLHIDFLGRFEHAQCVALLWAVEGNDLDGDSHRQLAATLQARWRSLAADV